MDATISASSFKVFLRECYGERWLKLNPTHTRVWEMLTRIRQVYDVSQVCVGLSRLSSGQVDYLDHMLPTLIYDRFC